MGIPRVKLNLSNGLGLGLTFLALVSFLLSVTGLLPARLVEEWFSRGAFPAISRLMATPARLTSSSLMDFLLPSALVAVGYLLHSRRPVVVLGLLSSGYLVFFWTWGLNYHRLPVEAKLGFESGRVTDESVDALVREAAIEINESYREFGTLRIPAESLVEVADSRVRSVVETLDGVPAEVWNAPAPVKSSRLLNPVFRAGSVTGMFNPFGHEALVAGGLLPVERPAVMLHELAHVRGYANEGEASFIALLAAVGSTNPQLRYSGWLSLWMYLRSPENDRLLDPGPLQDLEAIDQRVRGGRIEWVSRTQGRTLDIFLRANRVDDGIRSYAGIVRLAAGTRHDWDRFRDRSVQ